MMTQQGQLLASTRKPSLRQWRNFAELVLIDAASRDDAARAISDVDKETQSLPWRNSAEFSRKQVSCKILSNFQVRHTLGAAIYGGIQGEMPFT